MTVLRLMLFASVIVPALAQAGVYKWTDAEGRVHYSDSAPPQAKTQEVNIKVNSISGPAVVSTIGKSAAVNGKQSIRLFGTTWCGYCKKARALLVSKGIPYEDIDVEESARGRAEYKQLGAKGVPVILVGNQRMDGFDAGRLDSMLKQGGW